VPAIAKFAYGNFDTVIATIFAPELNDVRAIVSQSRWYKISVRSPVCYLSRNIHSRAYEFTPQLNASACARVRAGAYTIGSARVSLELGAMTLSKVEHIEFHDQN
jgi:hypothetical protein